MYLLFARACGTPSRLTMIYCQMRKGSVLSAGPPVTCLPSPVPVAPTSWSVSTTSRTSALALLEATRSSMCLQKLRTLQHAMGLKLRTMAHAKEFLLLFYTLTFLSFICAAINTHLPNWSHCSRLWQLVLSPMKTGHLKLTRFWKQIKTIKVVCFYSIMFILTLRNLSIYYS